MLITASDGSAPKPIAHFETGRIFGVEWLLDGSGVLFTYGPTGRHAVLIKDFR